jgi:hypothetical protein
MGRPRVESDFYRIQKPTTRGLLLPRRIRRNMRTMCALLPIPLDFPLFDLRFPRHLGDAKSHSIERGGVSLVSMRRPHGNP